MIENLSSPTKSPARVRFERELEDYGRTYFKSMNGAERRRILGRIDAAVEDLLRERFDPDRHFVVEYLTRDDPAFEGETSITRVPPIEWPMWAEDLNPLHRPPTDPGPNLRDATAELKEAWDALVDPVLAALAEGLALGLRLLRDPLGTLGLRAKRYPPIRGFITNGRDVDEDDLVDIGNIFYDLALRASRGDVRYKSGGIVFNKVEDGHLITANLYFEEKK